MLAFVDLDLFRASDLGSLVPISGYDTRYQREYDHYAFVPEPLPERVNLSPETYKVASDASSALGRLDQAGRMIPNAFILRRPLVRREAVSTSALEGTHAAFSDVLEADVSGKDRPRSPELQEVLDRVP